MTPIAATGTAPSMDQINSFIQQRLNAPERHGRPNLFQVVDQLNISDQAKQQVEQSMAEDMLSQQGSGSSSPAGTPGAGVPAGTSGAMVALQQATGAQGNSALSSAMQQLQQGHQDFLSAVQEISQGQSQGQTDLANSLNELKAGHEAMHAAREQAAQSGQSDSSLSNSNAISQTDPQLSTSQAASPTPSTSDSSAQLNTMLLQILTQQGSTTQGNSGQLLAAYTQNAATSAPASPSN